MQPIVAVVSTGIAPTFYITEIAIINVFCRILVYQFEK